MKIFKKISKPTLFLILIILVAIILRFWQLGNVPPSPNWDEAALGYNAYSILLTGKDEYGKFLPVILRSFDDYKPALYSYLVIPFVQFFGLSTFSVRVVSAISGVIAVVATYFLVKQLFSIYDTRKDDKKNTTEAIALLSAGLLAISPWHLQFSRIGFEAQTGLCFNILTVLFFLKSFKKNYFLVLSAFFAGLSIHVYQSEKVYLPLLIIALLVIFWKEFIKIPKKWIIASIFVGVLICLPLVYSILTDSNSLMRARGVSVFADQTQFLKDSVTKYADDSARKDVIGMVLDNRRVEYGKAIVAGYIAHFNLNWLFITGDIERHHAPGMGLLYLFEFPLIFMGIYLLFFGDYSKKTKLTIFAIFLLAPVPASITSGVPHAVRTINFLPTFQIFAALAILQLYYFVNGINIRVIGLKVKYFIFAFLLLIFVFNFLYFLNQYFVQQNKLYSESWLYGYKQAIDFVEPIKGEYDKVVVSNDRPLDQSYIFFLFYTGFDPKKYQELGGTVTGGFKEPHAGFDNYTFREIDFKNEKEGTLLIGRVEDFPTGAKVLKKVDYLDGEPAILVVER